MNCAQYAKETYVLSRRAVQIKTLIWPAHAGTRRDGSVKILMCIIAAEAMTQLVCKGEIFDPLRERLKSFSSFTDRLLSCPYCVSVWVAGFAVVLYVYYEWSWWFIYLLMIHRLSNVAHDIYKVVLNYKIDQVLNRK